MLVPSLFAVALLGIALELSRRVFYRQAISESEAILILCLAWILFWGALVLRLACVYGFCPLCLN